MDAPLPHASYRRPSPRAPRAVGILLGVLVGSGAMVASAGASGTDGPLRLSNATLPPVTTPEGNGYLDRVLAETFRRAELEFVIRDVPPARGLAQANAGILDGDVARIDVPSRLFPNLLRVPEPIIDVVFAGLHTRDDVVVENVEDFERYRVGYVRGWKIAELMFADVDSALPVRRPAQLLDMLEAGRIDLAFLTVAPARHLARSRNLGELDVTDFAIRRNLYLHLHESHADKVPRLSAALAAMKADGSYGELLRGYERKNR